MDFNVKEHEKIDLLFHISPCKKLYTLGFISIIEEYPQLQKTLLRFPSISVFVLFWSISWGRFLWQSLLIYGLMVWFISLLYETQNYRKGIKICKPLKNKGNQKIMHMSSQHIYKLQHWGCCGHRHGTELEKRRYFEVFRIYDVHPETPINWYHTALPCSKGLFYLKSWAPGLSVINTVESEGESWKKKG